MKLRDYVSTLSEREIVAEYAKCANSNERVLVHTYGLTVERAKFIMSRFVEQLTLEFETSHTSSDRLWEKQARVDYPRYDLMLEYWDED